MIFDESVRTYRRPATQVETEYSFLNRSADPVAAKVRDLIENWAVRYPAPEGASLRRRLEADFHPTFFEMFMHNLLVASGCEVELHPEVHAERATRPDFRATFPSGERVVIECVYPMGRSTAERSNDARLNVLYDGINEIRSAAFFLHLHEVTGLDQRQPSMKRLRQYIRERINSQDPDEAEAEVARSGYNALPTSIYRDGAFALEFSLWPKSAETRHEDADLIGVYPAETRWGGYGEVLRATLAQKVGKYGLFEDPFIIAVNTGRLMSSSPDELRSLYGNEGDPYVREYQIPRKGNGIWLGGSGPLNTRLSGVMFGKVFPWNLPVAPLRLYHNPWAQRPALGIPWRLSESFEQDGKLHWREGTTVGDLLGFPSEWPGKLFNGEADSGP